MANINWRTFWPNITCLSPMGKAGPFCFCNFINYPCKYSGAQAGTNIWPK